MKAEHSTYKSFGAESRADLWQTPEAIARLERIRSRAPAVHPVVRTHPETGRKALFVNEGYTTRLLGVDRNESDAVLGCLFNHIRTPEFQMRFAWKPGSLVAWDNRVTQHYAIADYNERRVMYRLALKGERPW
jgi:taurine dioxygenase